MKDKPTLRRRVFNVIRANPGIASAQVAELLRVDRQKVRSATSGMSEDGCIINTGTPSRACWEAVAGHPGPGHGCVPPGAKKRNPESSFAVPECLLERAWAWSDSRPERQRVAG